MALAGGLVFLLVHAARSGCDHDEVEHLHSAWLVAQGQTPFRDFIENHPPIIYYLLAPVTRALDGSPRGLVFAARTLDLGLLCIVLAVFVALVRPLLRSRRACWTAILLLGCFFFVRNSMEVRPDPWMAALSLIGFWQWCAFLRDGTLSRAALAGLSFGIAAVFLQKAAAFIGLVGIGTLLALPDRRALARAAKGAALAVTTAAVPVGAFSLAVWRAGYWRDFVFWNYTFNRFLYLEMKPVDLAPAAATIGISIGEDPVLWLIGFFGLAIAVRSIARRRAPPEVTAAATVVVGMLAVLFRSRFPFGHNLLLMQPSLALLAAAVVDRIELQRWRSLIAALLLLSVVKVGVLSLVYTEGHNSPSIQQLLLARTRSSDPVAVPPPYNPIFRPNAFFFWFLSEGFSMAYLECCRKYECPPGKVDQDRRAWQQRPPVYVFVPEDEPSWAPFEFAQHRAQYRSTDVPGLWKLAYPKTVE